jgi:hypothetical protein
VLCIEATQDAQIPDTVGCTHHIGKDGRSSQAYATWLLTQIQGSQ